MAAGDVPLLDMSSTLLFVNQSNKSTGLENSKTLSTEIVKKENNIEMFRSSSVHSSW